VAFRREITGVPRLNRWGHWASSPSNQIPARGLGGLRFSTPLPSHICKKYVHKKYI